MRVYIAGPDLFFRATWPAFVARVRSLCGTIGLEPIFPVPPEPLSGPGITSDASPSDAQMPHDACLRYLKSADALLVNLTPFRGAEPDSGTVWEAATAKALGKIVVGYTNQTDPHHLMVPMTRDPKDGAWLDESGALIERFGMPVNLMPGRGVHDLITVADATDPLAGGLRRIKALLDAQAQDSGFNGGCAAAGV